jgi:nickel/cobalt transporter (NicO) family protein
MPEPLVGLLVLAAISIGALHTVAPDHWVPFAAVARGRGWSLAKTVKVTALCGFGHVTVSVLLGLLALVFGLEMLQVFGRRMEAAAGLLLVGFGLAFGLAGLRRGTANRLAHTHAHPGPDGVTRVHSHPHCHRAGHSHWSGDYGHDTWTVRTLFLVFSADPCVAVIPILFAAAPLGALKTALVVGAYEVATILTMVAFVIPAHAATSLWRARWFERFGDATAGGLIAVTGILVAALGL